MAAKKFVSIGDLLINPELLAYATFEDDGDGPRVRLGFATASGASARAEVRLSGEEAEVAIRWLRLNSTPLTKEGTFGPIGRPVAVTPYNPPAEARPVDLGARAVAR